MLTAVTELMGVEAVVHHCLTRPRRLASAGSGLRDALLAFRSRPAIVVALLLCVRTLLTLWWSWKSLD